MKKILSLMVVVSTVIALTACAETYSKVELTDGTFTSVETADDASTSEDTTADSFIQYTDKAEQSLYTSGTATTNKEASSAATVPATQKSTTIPKTELYNEETPDIALFEGDEQAQQSPPSLCLQTTNDDITSVAYATMSGTYSWSYPDKNGKNVSVNSDGIRPCDDKKITIIKFDSCSGKVKLMPNASAESLSVTRYDIGSVADGNGTKIQIDENDIIYVAKGSYYEINAVYEQGEACYGFNCE